MCQHDMILYYQYLHYITLLCLLVKSFKNPHILITINQNIKIKESYK